MSAPSPADDFPSRTADAAAGPADDFDHLPPVEPPSARFIVQLFVVPALIVMLIVGVWLLFGKLAAGDQNWQSLVAELEVDSSEANVHRRDRAALMLAQMLSAAQVRPQAPADGAPRLTENPQLAEALARIYRQRLAARPSTEMEHKEQMYLSRALGLLDAPEAVPPLQEATRPEHDPEVRRNALIEIAVVANRAAERGPEHIARLAADRSLEADLIAASTADEPPVRHVAAYALGLFPTPAARDRLEVLLGNGDESTRANAAIGLARQNSTAGVAVFEEILARGSEAPRPGNGADEFESLVSLRAALKAVADLAAEFESAERDRLMKLLEPLAEKHRVAEIRIHAENALRALESARNGQREHPEAT
ncbi:MAG: HEAT repeat domain-containing protein [Planctomycetales bacterium]